MKHLLFLAALLFAMPVAAQTPPPAEGMVRIAIETTDGAIVLDLDAKHAPLTTANFLRYVDQKRLVGTGFYRAMKLGPGFGLVQGGPRNDPKRLLPPVAHEPTSQTGILHVDGTISLARDKPGSATADFFICIGDLKSLDADPAAPGDNQGFAAFGHVVSGMEVVRHILDAPTSPTEGAGVMRGQMLSPVVKILSARRVP